MQPGTALAFSCLCITGQLITSINAQHVAVWGWPDNPSKDWGFMEAKAASHTNTHSPYSHSSAQSGTMPDYRCV